MEAYSWKHTRVDEDNWTEGYIPQKVEEEEMVNIQYNKRYTISIVALMMFMTPCICSQEKTNCITMPFMQAALRAIEDPKGGVFLMTVRSVVQQRKSRVFMYWVTVEDVIKPYRNDEGVYYIPKAIVELTRDKKATLCVGKQYIIVTRLKFLLYDFMSVECSVKSESLKNREAVLKELHELSKRHAVYGSSRYLDYYLSYDLDVHGIRTKHHDGYIDPEPFGFTKSQIKKAIMNNWKIYLMRIYSVGDIFDSNSHMKAIILEDFLDYRDRGRQIELIDKRTYQDLVDESKKLQTPYALHKIGCDEPLLAIVKPEKDNLFIIVSYVVTLSYDDLTVSRVRKMVEEVSKTIGKRSNMSR